MMTTHLYILCGLPFSGKTTLAKTLVDRFGWTRIDLDDIKFELFGEAVTDDAIDQDGWDTIYQEMYRRIEQALSEGKTVIHDTGNFTKAERDIVRAIGEKLGIPVTTIFVDTPEEVARARMTRNRQAHARFDVTDDAFEETVRELEIPGDTEPHIIFHPGTPVHEWIHALKQRTPFRTAETSEMVDKKYVD